MLFLLCLLSAVDLEPRSADGLRGRLRIELAPEPEGIGLAGVWLRLTVSGSPAIEIEIDGPRLEDPLAAWRERVRLSTRTGEGTVVRSVYLVQRKQGPAPLPDVIVRVRAGPTAEWHEWAWYEPLGASKPVAPVEITPPPTDPWGASFWAVSFWAVWPWATAAIALSLLIGIVLWRGHHRPSKASAESPEGLALRLLEQTPDAEVEPLLRRYLEDAFALEGVALTRDEVLQRLDDWPESLRAELGAILAEAEAVRYGLPGGRVDRPRVTAWFASSGKFRDSGKNKKSE